VRAYVCVFERQLTIFGEYLAGIGVLHRDPIKARFVGEGQPAAELLSVARATAVEYESLNSALLIKPADL